jgi:hypothetical protein
MSPDDLDRILSTDDDIVPASGFAVSVMELVKREASAPSPIPFPWVRLAWGIAVMLGLALGLAWSGLTEPMAAPVMSVTQAAWSAAVASASDAAVRNGTMWAVGGLLLALASSIFSMRFASPRA